jgi:hypothetical protein
MNGIIATARSKYAGQLVFCILAAGHDHIPSIVRRFPCSFNSYKPSSSAASISLGMRHKLLHASSKAAYSYPPVKPLSLNARRGPKKFRKFFE